jgi:hypothetical protein
VHRLPQSLLSVFSGLESGSVTNRLFDGLRSWSYVIDSVSFLWVSICVTSYKVWRHMRIWPDILQNLSSCQSTDGIRQSLLWLDYLKKLRWADHVVMLCQWCRLPWRVPSGSQTGGWLYRIILNAKHTLTHSINSFRLQWFRLIDRRIMYIMPLTRDEERIVESTLLNMSILCSNYIQLVGRWFVTVLPAMSRLRQLTSNWTADVTR